MCGRTRCKSTTTDISNFLGTTKWHQSHLYKPRENLSPGWNIPVLIRDDQGNRCVRTMSWGLIPSFTKPDEKPDFFKMYNARSESLTEKPSFKKLVERHRCIAIVDGYYEWKTELGKKQPYYVYFADKRPMKIAALYDIWKSNTIHNDESDELLYTVTFLTSESSQVVRFLHIRQPVILDDDKANIWLDTNSDNTYQDLYDIIKIPYGCSDFVYHPVSMKMNKASYQEDDCSLPVQLFPSIDSFFQKSSFLTTKSKEVKPLNMPASDVESSVDAVTLSHNTKDLRQAASEVVNLLQMKSDDTDDALKEVNSNSSSSNQFDDMTDNETTYGSSSTGFGYVPTQNDTDSLNDSIHKLSSVHHMSDDFLTVDSSISSYVHDGDHEDLLQHSHDLSQDGNLLGSCFCPICGLDITAWDEKTRNVHAYSCDGDIRPPVTATTVTAGPQSDLMPSDKTQAATNSSLFPGIISPRPGNNSNSSNNNSNSVRVVSSSFFSRTVRQKRSLSCDASAYISSAVSSFQLQPHQPVAKKVKVSSLAVTQSLPAPMSTSPIKSKTKSPMKVKNTVASANAGSARKIKFHPKSAASKSKPLSTYFATSCTPEV